MSYEILVHPKVAKAIKNLPRAQRAKLAEFIEALKDNPVPFKRFDIRKLEGQKNRYRARLGDFRLTYEVDKKDRIVILLKLERRERAYR